MRTAVWTALICLLTFAASPIAFAETSDSDSLSLEGTYSTQDGKHIIEVTLPQAEQPTGNWVVTLNGSDEQASPEGTSLDQFTTQYDDLVEGRNYQVIAVFYGKDGKTPVDLNTCFEFKANAADDASEPVVLKDCGLGGGNLDETDAVEVDTTESHSTGSKDTAPGDEDSELEESGILSNMMSGTTVQQGGPMPETSISSLSWFAWGGHLMLVGCALLGFRSPRQDLS
ncbi:hypothetical protein [Desmospora activa]|uniref:LPXTG-motif cell wall-anchored protein n=1 Tax=Desmospora activa DSM 45169 TaxID=1121389 RepID=A0A2T4Z408_9BACL|nr:hypothetical protein [Desmospora activa]PTM56622.1 hypothetical protein C8J48_2947 [Desmospora activa DSM 45169]